MPLDTTGDFYDGTQITSPAELTAALMKRPTPLVRTFTENLMAYALGRRVEYFDQPTIRAIARKAESGQLQDVVVHPGRRQERRVPDEARGSAGDDRRQQEQRSVIARVSESTFTVEETQTMYFITGKHLPRRTFLRGVGATVALPFLDAMVPAGRVFAQGAARPIARA